MNRAGWRLPHPLGVAGVLMVPWPALAHSFGQVYRLPVPVWLYLYGACAALALSFLVLVYFMTAPAQAQTHARTARVYALADSRLARWVRRARLARLLELAGVAMLLLCIACGVFGVPSPYANFSMTAFWIVFVLGLTYVSVMIGDIYRFANPWRALATWLGRSHAGRGAGRIAYPARLAYWPAVVFYMAFVWLELFGDTDPQALAMVLAGYTGINIIGAFAVGAGPWFRYCELFSVFFRLIASMAPLAYDDRHADVGRRAILRLPFAGLRDLQLRHLSLLVFILFMLSSTAFDGLHETTPWRRLFWIDLYRLGLADWVGANPLAAFPAMLQLYVWWQGVCLLLSPFVYLAIYLLFVWLARLCAGGSGRSVIDLAKRFAPSLLPIALAYHISHYYTLLQTQGFRIVPLASDPFGYGWNLFGTADWWQRANVPEPTTVWHVQVGVIVLGHIVGVYISHAIALEVFASRRRAALSQLPMLALMLVFTAAGLWILAQPIAG